MTMSNVIQMNRPPLDPVKGAPFGVNLGFNSFRFCVFIKSKKGRKKKWKGKRAAFQPAESMRDLILMPHET